jgi:hypothetical protein
VVKAVKFDAHALSTATSPASYKFEASDTLEIADMESLSLAGMPDPPLISVETQSIDLGRLEIGERKDCYFTVKNLSAEPVSLSVRNEDGTQYDTMPATLAANDSTRIYVHVTPSRHGSDSKKYQCCAADGNSIEVNFAFFGIFRQYLALGDDIGGDLLLGECFIDSSRRFAKVVPYSVRNITEFDLIVTASSNLSQQCLIFSDSALTNAVQDYVLSSGTHAVFFVAVQPNVNQQSSILQPLIPIIRVQDLASDQDILSCSVDSRELVGGIKFQICLEEAGKRQPLISQSLKVYFSTLGTF